MSEIEKMYENAGIYDFRYDCNVSFTDGDFGCITCCSKSEVKDYCTDGQYFKGAKVIKVKHLYPPFTAEKQIELIKWLNDTDYYIHNIYKTIDTKEYCIENDFYDIQTNKFEETLAGLINKLWVDLTEEEHKQIKEILE